VNTTLDLSSSSSETLGQVITSPNLFLYL
jgi:hypothetical protein